MALAGNEPRTIDPDSPMVVTIPTVVTIKVLFAYPGLRIRKQGSRGRAQMLAGASDHRNYIREADRAVKQLMGARARVPHY
jgi:hypothetical protein